MATSPQCSPMRAHTGVMADQHNAGSSAQSAFHQHQPQQQQQRLNFDECKEGDDSTQMQLESESHQAQAPQFSSFNTFSGGFSNTTFTSLQPTMRPPPQSQSAASSSAFASQPRASPSYTSPAPMSKRTRRQGQHDVSMDDAEHGATDNAHESPFPKMKRAAVGQ